MTDAEEKEYLEGKIRGLEIIRDVLINALAGLQPTLSREIDFRLRVSNSIERMIAEFSGDPRRISLPFSQGAREALTESKDKFFSD